MGDPTTSSILHVLIISSVVLTIIGILGLRSILVTDTNRAVRSEVIGRVIAALSLCIYVLYCIPMMEKLFLDYGVNLSTLSVWVIQLRHKLDIILFVRMPVFFALVTAVAVNVGFFRDLHLQDATRARARLWSGAITTLVMASLTLIALAMLLPTIELLNNLN